jgi:hypothetical protein
MHRHHRTLALVSVLLTGGLAAAAVSSGGSQLFSLFSANLPVTAGRAHHAAALQRPKPALKSRARSRAGGPFSLDTALTFAAVNSLVALAGLVALAALLVKNRLDARERRDYQLYEIHLSMHDDAKPRDLRDMVEAFAAAVRQWPINRARFGQPYFAVETHYWQGPDGMQFLIGLRCERDLVVTLQSVLANAYPDVRVGQIDGSTPRPLRGRLREPGYVLRFRKERAFIYPLAAREEGEDASVTMEAIAQTQVMVGAPSSIRLQFTPAPLGLEGWARHKFRAHEDRLARSEQRLIRSDAGLRSVLNQEEMRDAGRALDSGMCWFEVQVAAPTGALANRVAASLIARRGENRLQRRRMLARLGLYCRRFPDGYPPLLPTFSFGRFHSLASAGEVAHLLALPSARMKAVPVKRLTIPRLPPPPEIARTPDRRVPTPGEEPTLAMPSAPPVTGSHG